MSGAYGLSIYFPYYNMDYANMVSDVYDSIGMEPSYASCVKKFAATEMSGQYISGGSSNPFNSLFGIFGSGDYGSSYYYGNDTGSSYSESSVYDMLGSLLGGDTQSFSGYDSSDFGFFRGSFDQEKTAEFIAKNQFLESNLEWKTGKNKVPVITLPEDQWDLVTDLSLNMFIDDGEGFIDLGLDNVFTFEGDDMYADMSGAWLGLNGQIMPYYHSDTYENGDEYTITGYAPCLLNGVRSKLIIVFDNAHPEGYVAGAVADYSLEASVPEGATAKSTLGLNKGDRIQFVCDYYDYDYNYDDSYKFGNEITVDENLKVSDVTLDNLDTVITYRFTDIYQDEFWLPKIVPSDFE